MRIRWGGNECTAHNFSLFAIFLPKVVKIGGNLTKFWQKQFCTSFWDTVLHGMRLCGGPDLERLTRASVSAALMPSSPSQRNISSARANKSAACIRREAVSPQRCLAGSQWHMAHLSQSLKCTYITCQAVHDNIKASRITVSYLHPRNGQSHRCLLVGLLVCFRVRHWWHSTVILGFGSWLE